MAIAFSPLCKTRSAGDGVSSAQAAVPAIAPNKTKPAKILISATSKKTEGSTTDNAVNSDMFRIPRVSDT